MSNSSSFAINFICNFLCIFQCNLLCTPACKTNIQGPPGKGGVEVLRLRDQLGVSGESYPVLPGHPLPSSRTLLFSSKPPLPSAARRCPVLPQLPQQCSPSSHSSHSSLSSSQAARSGHSFRTAAANRPHQQQQGDLGGKCSQAASNGHHFSPAQYCPVLTYPGHPPTTAAATTTTATTPTAV